ncbi:hypothetical protein BB558_005951 [Smittium angustum]|uniref:Ankyrin repeat protein n=2 Tax=Smittium angustum TaxID=133377 RepID=A0A2U1IYZ1_SMIAN|nr:hypothetical protein BB558_005951 [Smittium angustum]
MQNDSEKLDVNKNNAFLNLGFDILGMIFIEARNPELSTVSKLLYYLAHNVSVQLEYHYRWCSFDSKDNSLYNRERMCNNHSFVLGLIRKGVPNIDYKKIYNIALKSHNTSVLKAILEGSRTKVGYSEKNEKTHIFEPLVDINKCYSNCYCHRINKEILNLIEDACNIQVNTEKNIKMSPDISLGKANGFIHEKLTRDTFLHILNCFIIKSNFEMINHILKRINLDQTGFDSCFISSLNSKNLQVVKFIFELKNKNGFLITYDAIRQSYEYGNPEIIRYISVTTEYPINPREIVDVSIRKNRFETFKHFFDKVKSGREKAKFLKLALEFRRIEILNFLIDDVQLSRIDIETRKEMVGIDDIRFLKKLVDKGIDIHLDDDHIFRFCIGNHYKDNESIDLIKKLLVLGANVYIDESKYLELLIRHDPRLVSLILKYSKKPHPNSGKLFRAACFHGYDGIAKTLLKAEKNLVSRNKTYASQLVDQEKFKFMKNYLD